MSYKRLYSPVTRLFVQQIDQVKSKYNFKAVQYWAIKKFSNAERVPFFWRHNVSANHVWICNDRTVIVFLMNRQSGAWSYQLSDNGQQQKLHLQFSFDMSCHMSRSIKNQIISYRITAYPTMSNDNTNILLYFRISFWVLDEIILLSEEFQK